MIPPFNVSNVLPPYSGSDPTIQSLVSPYEVTMSELVLKFNTSPERRKILNGLMQYRARLAQLQIVSGFQLIDGSFVENCEALRGRAPADIDIVTFAHSTISKLEPRKWIEQNKDVFHPPTAKINFQCDAYFVDLNKNPQLVAEDSFYWFGLFSHQRSSNLWKGMLRIPLVSDDAAVGTLS